MTASANGDLSEVQRLISAGAPVNAKEKGGWTALHYAAQTKKPKIVEALIAAGGDVNAETPEKITPLILSVDMAFGDPEISLELLRAGADPSVAGESGDTALIISATESSSEVMSEILRRGANPNAQNDRGETALHFAALNAELDRVAILLKFGANPNLKNKQGQTALDLANTTNPDKRVQFNFTECRILLQTATAGSLTAAGKN